MNLRRERRYTVEQRLAVFWSRVEKGPGCWLWTGAVSNGYGSFWDGERTRGAHVWIWEQEHGPVPPGKEVRHGCDVPLCVRHLLLGTRADNVADMVNRGRSWYQLRPEVILRGDRHGKTKIPDALVPVLRARREAGDSLGKLAQELGVTKQAVAYAVAHRGGDA